MRRAWPAIAAAGAVALAGGVVMLDALSAVAVGLAVAGVGLVLQRLGAADEPWRGELAPPERQGERREAMELTWALAGRDGRVGPRALRQVQGIAAHRLRRHGLSLESADDEAAVRALVGRRALATLRCARHPWPRLSDVEHVAKVLERLGSGTPARNPTTSRSNPR